MKNLNIGSTRNMMMEMMLKSNFISLPDNLS